MDKLTPEELAVMDHLAMAWNKFLELHQRHPDEVPDFRKAIHDAQRIILSRPAIHVLQQAESQ